MLTWSTDLSWGFFFGLSIDQWNAVDAEKSEGLCRVKKESLVFKGNCNEAISEMNLMSKKVDEVKDQHQATADAYNWELEALKTRFANKEDEVQQTIASQKEAIGACELKP